MYVALFAPLIEKWLRHKLRCLPSLVQQVDQYLLCGLSYNAKVGKVKLNMGFAMVILYDMDGPKLCIFVCVSNLSL